MSGNDLERSVSTQRAGPKCFTARIANVAYWAESGLAAAQRSYTRPDFRSVSQHFLQTKVGKVQVP